MGYDMRIRGEVPAASEHDIEQARDAYDAAHAALQARRNAGEFNNSWDAFWEAMQPVDELWSKLYRLKSPEYFQLNIHGMGRYREAMADLGMAHWSDDPVTQGDWDNLPEWETDEDEAAYREAADKLTAQHGASDNPTIPLHKLSSNDGWFVTPDEIRAALEVWDAHDLDGLSTETHSVIETDYWGEFIAWLRLAAEHDGFRVH